MVPRSALWEALEGSFHQRMLFEGARRLLPTSIRQVEPLFSEVEQVGLVVGARRARRQLKRLRSAGPILVLFLIGLSSPNLCPSQ